MGDPQRTRQEIRLKHGLGDRDDQLWAYGELQRLRRLIIRWAESEERSSQDLDRYMRQVAVLLAEAKRLPSPDD